MNNFDTIYKDILSKDKVYLDLISHIKNFSANEKIYKESNIVVYGCYDDD